MIAKHIHSSYRSSFRKMAMYIADAEEEGEKLEYFWAVNCNFGEDYEDLDLIIAEVEATQGLNRKALKNRNYHLVLSFRDEKPPVERLVDIERRFASELGLAENQAVAATHVNTANFHMHVAYNLIHPREHTNISPFRDYWKLEKTCRAVEKQYGLKRDMGRADYAGNGWTLPDRARTKEFWTWERSFFSYARDKAGKLEEGLRRVETWRQFHEMIGDCGLLIVESGKGLAFRDHGNPKHYIKASGLGRQFGKPGLEARLGPFEPMGPDQAVAPKETFQKTPVTSHPEQGWLWGEFAKSQNEGLRENGVKPYANWRAYLEAHAATVTLAAEIVKEQLAGKGPVPLDPDKRVVPFSDEAGESISEGKGMSM